VESCHSPVLQLYGMSDQTDRLIMQVAEPWNFGSEPVRLSVKERASPNRWTVSVTSGWSPASEAVLAARYEGEQVGEWRYFDERLTMFLLRFRRRHRFGAGADVPTYPPPIVYGPDEQIPFDPEAELDGCFEGGDFQDEPSPGDDDDASSAANGEEE
jgi:hypothetical protein